MAQSLDHPTLDLGSGHDPRIVGSSPTLGSTLSKKPAWDSLSPFAPLPCSLSHSLSQKVKKKNTLDRISSGLEETEEWKNGLVTWGTE